MIFDIILAADRSKAEKKGKGNEQIQNRRAGRIDKDRSLVCGASLWVDART